MRFYDKVLLLQNMFVNHIRMQIGGYGNSVLQVQNMMQSCFCTHTGLSSTPPYCQNSFYSVIWNPGNGILLMLLGITTTMINLASGEVKLVVESQTHMDYTMCP